MNPHGCCILQVEDEESDLLLLRFGFEQVGIEVPLQAVTDGQMAIDYLSGNGAYADRQSYPLPCLLLLDLKLPKLSGLETLAWIRRQPAWAHLVVIVFSSSSQPRDIERAYALGANSFVQKPSDFEQTLQLLRHFKGWWLEYNCFAPPGEEPGEAASP